LVTEQLNAFNVGNNTERGGELVLSTNNFSFP